MKTDSNGITVLYSDDCLLVVDKPSGISCTPDRYDPKERVLRDLLAPEWGSLLTVHRIDKDTSGITILARTEDAHRAINAMFESKSVRKQYFAIARGVPDWAETVIDSPLRTDGDREHRTVVDPSKGKEALTRFFLMERLRSYSLIRAEPETGRIHQIRAHLAAAGYPIACDPLYGDGKPVLLSRLKRSWRGDEWEEKPLIARTALHAFSVSFPHPSTGTAMSFESPYPRDFSAALNQLRKIFGGSR
jgi:RluA family pseudouridine synthase